MLTCTIVWHHACEQHRLFSHSDSTYPLERFTTLRALDMDDMAERLRSVPERDGDWVRLKAGLIREEFSFHAPEPTRLDPRSPAALAAAVSLREAPLLFGAEDEPCSRLAAFAQMFFSLGNSLDWANGILSCYRGEQKVCGDPVLFWQKKLAATEVNEMSLRLRASTEGERQTNQVCPRPPLKLGDVSTTFCQFATMPDDIEDNFLLAGAELIDFLRKRPLWENWSRQAHELTGDTNGDCYRDGSWRHLLLADGARNRAIVDEIARMFGRFRPRLMVLGLDLETTRYGIDYRLPPACWSATGLVDWT